MFPRSGVQIRVYVCTEDAIFALWTSTRNNDLEFPLMILFVCGGFCHLDGPCFSVLGSRLMPGWALPCPLAKCWSHLQVGLGYPGCCWDGRSYALVIRWSRWYQTWTYCSRGKRRGVCCLWTCYTYDPTIARDVTTRGFAIGAFYRLQPAKEDACHVLDNAIGKSTAPRWAPIQCFSVIIRGYTAGLAGRHPTPPLKRMISFIIYQQPLFIQRITKNLQ